MAKVQPEVAEKELMHSKCGCYVTTCMYCPCICMKVNCPGKLETLKPHYMEPEAGASRAQTGASGAEVFIPTTDEAKILFVGRNSRLTRRARRSGSPSPGRARRCGWR